MKRNTVGPRPPRLEVGLDCGNTHAEIFLTSGAAEGAIFCFTRETNRRAGSDPPLEAGYDPGQNR